MLECSVVHNRREIKSAAPCMKFITFIGTNELCPARCEATLLNLNPDRRNISIRSLFCKTRVVEKLFLMFPERKQKVMEQ